MSAEPDAWRDAWTTTLAELELSLDEAEALLAAGREHEAARPAPWSPPAGIGRMPASLAERARTLLARQLEVARQLGAAASDSRRHDRAIARMTTATPAPPVYIDTPA